MATDPSSSSEASGQNFSSSNPRSNRNLVGQARIPPFKGSNQIIGSVKGGKGAQQPFKAAPTPSPAPENAGDLKLVSQTNFVVFSKSSKEKEVAKDLLVDARGINSAAGATVDLLGGCSAPENYGFKTSVVLAGSSCLGEVEDGLNAIVGTRIGDSQKGANSIGEHTSNSLVPVDLLQVLIPALGKKGIVTFSEELADDPKPLAFINGKVVCPNGPKRNILTSGNSWGYPLRVWKRIIALLNNIDPEARGDVELAAKSLMENKKSTMEVQKGDGQIMVYGRRNREGSKVGGSKGG